jgi:hypothetical protein
MMWKWTLFVFETIGHAVLIGLVAYLTQSWAFAIIDLQATLYQHLELSGAITACVLFWSQMRRRASASLE